MGKRRQGSKRRYKTGKMGEFCKNHPQRRADTQCQKCKEYYCTQCVEDVWKETRIVEQALGQKREFKRQFLCKKCERRDRIIRVMEAIALLILFLMPVLFVLIN